MKYFHLDWGASMGYAVLWQSLPRATRARLLELEPKAPVPAHEFGDALAHLLQGDVLRTHDEKRVRPSDAFHDTHKLLRALQRHPLLAPQSNRQALHEYAAEHLTSGERTAFVDYGWGPERDTRLVAKVASAGHLRGFLAAKKVAAWEREHLRPTQGWSREAPSKPVLDTPRAGDDLRRVLEPLMAERQPIPLHALEGRVEKLPRGRLGAALEAGLRYLLCFVSLDAELVPVVHLWPAVSERLHRPPAPPPAVVVPTKSLCLAWAHEDLVAVLVRAAEPLRVKSDGWRLFAAVQRELEEALVPLPPWLQDTRLFPENAQSVRVRTALELAEHLGLMEPRGKPGRDFGVATSAAGWTWLGRSAHERSKELLDLFRPTKMPPGQARSSAEEDTPFDGDGEDDGVDPYLTLDEEPYDSPRPSLELSESSLFGQACGGVLLRSALDAFGALAPGSAVCVGDFLRYHLEASNPFHGLEPRRKAAFTSPWEPASEELFEALWQRALVKLLHEVLLPFGGVSVGLANPGGLTLELTSAGRYLLGFEPDFVLPAPVPSSSKPVHVQPDFEIVFASASPALEAAISRFAERKGRGVGVLFRITRESILGAAQAGLGADQVLDTLTSASTKSLPSNVTHEIKAWFARCRKLSLESVQLIRCPDAETAARVLGAAGVGKLEALTPTLLVLTDLRHKAAVLRACRKAGIFLRDEAPRDLAVAKRRRRRRADWL